MKEFKGQLARVWNVMSDGTWHTLANIRETISASTDSIDGEAGISARLRDLRAKGLTVERRKRSRKLYEYRIVSQKGQIGLFEENSDG